MLTPKQIRSRRRALNWTQAELGQAIGVTNAGSAKVLVSLYERATRPPGVVSETRLAELERVLAAEEQVRREFAAFRAGKLAK